MFRGKHGSAAALALLFMVASSVALITPSAVAEPTDSADKRLWQAQQSLLDPQTQNAQPVEPAAARKSRTADVHRTEAAGEAAASATLAPAAGGRWGYLQPLAPGFNAIHVVVGRGKILLVAGSGNEANQLEAGTFSSYVCNAALSGCRSVETPVDLFCAGHVLLPDGRALVGGGTTSYTPFKGAKFLYAFNFTTEKYEQLTPMEVGRWYPSMVTMFDGKTLITGGIDHNGVISGSTEIFDHRTDTHQKLSGTRKFPMYSRIVATKRGDYFFSGSAYGADTGSVPPGFWNPNTNTYQPVAGLRTPRQRSSSASCFAGDLRDQRILVMGGGSPAVNSTDRIKLSTTSSRFVAGPTLKANKQYLSCLSMPDGTLLEAGGGSANKVENASYEVSMLKYPTNKTFAPLNPIPTGNHRLYHSSHFLLDDGRVVSLGSDPKGQPRSETVLAYSPPYLYKGTRPTITAAPDVVKRGSTISVSTTGGATRLTITKPPSPTHGMDAGDGYMSFPITNGKVDLSGATARFLPEGNYRIWAVNAQGAVSKARWISLCESTTAGDDCGCCH